MENNLQFFLNNLWFNRYFLAKEVDERGQKNRDEQNEIERQKAMEKETHCKFSRINPDGEGIDINTDIGKILNHINKSLI